MRKSIYLFLGIVIALFITDRLTYAVLRHFEKKIFIGDSAGKVNYFNTVKDSVDLLIFGSSRAVHHVDPELFAVPAFNMGVDGKRIAYAAGLIQTLNKKGQVIFVHIDHAKLYEQEYDGTDLLSLLNEGEDNPELMELLDETFPEDVIISKIFKCYSYNGKVFPVFKNYFLQGKNVKSDGFVPLNPTMEQKEIFQKIYESRTETLVQDISKPFKVNPLANKCIDRIIEKGKRNGSEIVFFTSPSLLIVNEDVRLNTLAYFKEKGVTYFDDVSYFSNMDFSLWQDYTHMSKKGAEIYSEKLIKEYREAFDQ